MSLIQNYAIGCRIWLDGIKRYWKYNTKILNMDKKAWKQIIWEQYLGKYRVENEQCTSKYILWQSVIADKYNYIFLESLSITFSLID